VRGAAAVSDICNSLLRGARGSGRQKPRLLPAVIERASAAFDQKTRRQKPRLLPAVIERASAAFDQKTRRQKPRLLPAVYRKGLGRFRSED
jgi:hypothetical protein